MIRKLKSGWCHGAQEKGVLRENQGGQLCQMLLGGQGDDKKVSIMHGSVKVVGDFWEQKFQW